MFCCAKIEGKVMPEVVLGVCINYKKLSKIQTVDLHGRFAVLRLKVN